jgi:hypothetical protein
MLDAAHPGVSEFDGYRDRVDGDMPGAQPSEVVVPGWAAVTFGKLACWAVVLSKGVL